MNDVVIRNGQAVEEAIPFGPCMSRLSAQRQAFVLALLAEDSGNGASAAVAAGYSSSLKSARVLASRLRHDPKVLEAIGEAARAQLWSLRASATSTIQEVLQDPNARARDRLSAAGMVLDRTDLPSRSERHVTIEHTVTDAENLRSIVKMARQLGADPRALLGEHHYQRAVEIGAIDVEFVEVKPPSAAERKGLVHERAPLVPTITSSAPPLTAELASPTERPLIVVPRGHSGLQDLL